jgi:hypothetical protein
MSNTDNTNKKEGKELEKNLDKIGVTILLRPNRPKVSKTRPTNLLSNLIHDLFWEKQIGTAN